MLPFRKFLAFSLLFISLFPCISNAGLYSSDYNNFSHLKKKLTDVNNYRYAALVYPPLNGNNFDVYLILAKTYAEILEKDMGIKIQLDETDALHIQNIQNFRNYATQEISRKDFEPGNSSCSIATTFLYPSAVSDLLRIMGTDIIAKDDPAIRAEIFNESKQYLAGDLSLLMKMCDRSKFREQNNAFTEFLKALEKAQPYILSEVRMNLQRTHAIAASAAEDAARAAASKKALEERAAKDKKDQEIENAREAKVIADREAALAEKKRQAQLQEDARQKALAARTPEQVQHDQQQSEDIHRCYKFAAMYKVATEAYNRGYSIEQSQLYLVDLKGLKGEDADAMRDTIKIVPLTHANDTPMQAFTFEYDTCLAYLSKKHAAIPKG